MRRSKQTNKLGVIIAISITATLALIGGVFYLNSSANAVTSGDWQAGSIVSDLEFTNSSSMSVSDIQAFLNSQNPNCDTNGTQRATEKGRPDITHAQYASLKGWAGPPYVCLKDFYEVPKSSPSPEKPANNFSGSIPSGAVSAAQMIYNAAQKYKISPKTLLVKLATESAGPLTSDNWPLESQYTYAMGSHCPDSGIGDSANCDKNYSGFSIQIQSAAELLRWYLDSMSQPWWSYKKPYQNNNILWNTTSTGCGAGNVYINTSSTAALYTYTPYQPNQAALNNMYGTGDRCSAYGNRNFWRVWNDLFGSTQNEPNVIQFKSHISTNGWTGWLKNRGITGTVGQSLPMEAMQIKGNVDYSTYSFNTGWQPTVSNGMLSGTTSVSRPVQAIKISPQSSISSQYDIYYRVHISEIGWLGWAKNGDSAGVTGDNTNRIEALEIQVLPKGTSAPGSTENAYINKGTVSPTPALLLKQKAHVSDWGWQPVVTNDMTIGTTEQSRRIEAINLELSNTTGLSGSITYDAHVRDIGWQPYVTNGQDAGTTGKSLPIEAVRIGLTGALGNSYDIWYRAYIQDKGWQGWAKNGSPAGSVGQAMQVEAVETHIFPKNTSPYTESGSLYNPRQLTFPDTYTITYNTHQSEVGWVNGTAANQVGGTTGKARTLEALRFTAISSIFDELGIQCKAYSRGLGWSTPASLNSTCGTTGKSSPLQGIQLSLTGNGSQKYDVYYRVHLSEKGWQDWVKNGATAGTEATNINPIEAVTIKLVPKP